MPILSTEIPKFVPTASTPTPRYAPTLNEVLEESEPLIYFNLQSPVCLPVTLSDTLTLKPTVLGRQPVVLNWFKDSEVVTQSARLRVSGSNDQQLELYPPFGTDDSGSYEIKACNSMGCKSRGVQLFFYSKGLLTREFSYWEETNLGMNSSQFLAISLLLFTIHGLGVGRARPGMITPCSQALGSILHPRIGNSK